MCGRLEFGKINPHKGLGPDSVPCLLIEAGGFSLALLASQLAEYILEQETWPSGFKGGRLVDLFKGRNSGIMQINLRSIERDNRKPFSR